MKLLRIGVANFRSIGAQPVMIDLQKRINLLIGANNSGKSNVLTIFQRLEKMREPNDRAGISGTDRHRRDDAKNLELVLEIERTSEDEFPDGRQRFHFSVSEDVCHCLASPFHEMEYDSIMHYFRKWGLAQFHGIPTDDELTEAQQACAYGAFSSSAKKLPSIAAIPEARKIAQGEYKFDGTGVVELLGRWQSPVIGKEPDRLRFQKVQGFLRELLGAEDITLDVTRETNELIVQSAGLWLPLANYGTGIHQLIILVIAVLAHENAWVSIEEPEIHLHPLLQKAFLRFLIDKTTNKYILTTHSNAFLSRPDESHIVHLWLEDGETKNRVVETTGHILEVLNDLGIRAADILQANFVIWVEGPSDRIYLNHWLRLADPGLAEGIDYSIMYYGGRLLSHLTMEREDDDLTTDELIKLLRINQHSAILIDSDCKKGNPEINPTKARIRKECKGGEVMCWVTEGREVENYIPPEAFAAAYKEMTKTDRVFKVGRLQKIESALQTEYRTVWKPKLAYDKDKVGFARRIVPHMKELPDRFDLRKRIEELVGRIHKAR